jgi:hypothetical protein
MAEITRDELLQRLELDGPENVNNLSLKEWKGFIRDHALLIKVRLMLLVDNQEVLDIIEYLRTVGGIDAVVQSLEDSVAFGQEPINNSYPRAPILHNTVSQKKLKTQDVSACFVLLGIIQTSNDFPKDAKPEWILEILTENLSKIRKVMTQLWNNRKYDSIISVLDVLENVDGFSVFLKSLPFTRKRVEGEKTIRDSFARND